MNIFRLWVVTAFLMLVAYLGNDSVKWSALKCLNASNTQMPKYPSAFWSSGLGSLRTFGEMWTYYRLWVRCWLKMGSLMQKVQIERGISKDTYDPRRGGDGNLGDRLFLLVMIMLKLVAIPCREY